MFHNANLRPFLPYFTMIVGLSKRNCNYQETIESINQLAQLSHEITATSFDSTNKEVVALYTAFRILLQTYSASYRNDEEDLFVYEDFPLSDRLTNSDFLEIRERAATVLLTMNLTLQQKIGILTGFLFISRSSAARGEYGTAEQLKHFRENSRVYLTNKVYFIETGLQIKDTVNSWMTQHQKIVLNNYIANANAIHQTAANLYKNVDDYYAHLTMENYNQITQQFDKARKKAIRKAIKNIEIGIAGMIVTASAAPYLLGFIYEIAAIGALAGTEALLTTLAIDAITYSALSTGTEAVLKGNFKGSQKNFVQQVEIRFGTGLTSALVATNPPNQIVKGSIEAIKVSAATSALKNALQTVFNNGKINDILKSAVVGGVAGAATEKLMSQFKDFDAGIALGNITKRVLDDVLKTSVQSTIVSVGENGTDFNMSGVLVDALTAGLTSYIAGHFEKDVKNIASIENTEARKIDPAPLISTESSRSTSSKNRSTHANVQTTISRKLNNAKENTNIKRTGSRIKPSISDVYIRTKPDRYGSIYSQKGRISNNTQPAVPDRKKEAQKIIETLLAFDIFPKPIAFPLNNVLRLKEVIERFDYAPHNATMTEKIICGASNVGTEIVITTAGLKILTEFVMAGFVAAPVTDGWSLLAFPLALYAAPKVTELGNIGGVVTQKACHATFRLIEDLPKETSAKNNISHKLNGTSRIIGLNVDLNFNATSNKKSSFSNQESTKNKQPMISSMMFNDKNKIRDNLLIFDGNVIVKPILTK